MTFSALINMTILIISLDLFKHDQVVISTLIHPSSPSTMGSVRGGARPPSHTAYFVALAGILVLLLMLCCYFFYFCVKRVKGNTSISIVERGTTANC